MTSGQWKGVFILLMVVLISAAHGHDGTVNISGTIQDNTCELAPDSQNKSIDMGTFAASQFTRVGDWSPAKKFTLNLQNCGPAASGAVVTFSGTMDGQNSELFAVETGGDSAIGLGLGIYDANGKIIAPGGTSAGITLEPGEASAEFVFSARYVSVLDSITAGKTNVIVTFIVSYE